VTTVQYSPVDCVDVVVPVENGAVPVVLTIDVNVVPAIVHRKSNIQNIIVLSEESEPK
jgi:hypothetical protein